EQQFVTTETHPEAVSQEPVFHKGEAPFNPSHSLRTQDFLLDHGFPPSSWSHLKGANRASPSSPLLQRPMWTLKSPQPKQLCGRTRPSLQRHPPGSASKSLF